MCIVCVVVILRVLMKQRDRMRADKTVGCIPVTIDELMTRFCINEKRKEADLRYNESKELLLQDNIGHLSVETVKEHVE